MTARIRPASPSDSAGLLASQPQRLLELERYWLMTVIK